MTEPINTISTCRIAGHKVWLNGILIYEDVPELDLLSFLKNLYKYVGISYPKFFKMDNLCKLAFLCAEIVIENTPAFKDTAPYEKGIVLANSHSSLDTDIKYYNTIKDSGNYFPSPALFVYTLPNITIGEVAIRHKITGESCFFVTESDNPSLLQDYTKHLFRENLIKLVLAGWVDVLFESYEAMFQIEKKL